MGKQGLVTRFRNPRIRAFDISKYIISFFQFLSPFSARSDSSEFLTSSPISSPARRDSDEIPKVKS